MRKSKGVRLVDRATTESCRRSKPLTLSTLATSGCRRRSFAQSSFSPPQSREGTNSPSSEGANCQRISHTDDRELHSPRTFGFVGKTGLDSGWIPGLIHPEPGEAWHSPDTQTPPSGVFILFSGHVLLVDGDRPARSRLGNLRNKTEPLVSRDCTTALPRTKRPENGRSTTKLGPYSAPFSWTTRVACQHSATHRVQLSKPLPVFRRLGFS